MHTLISILRWAVLYCLYKDQQAELGRRPSVTITSRELQSMHNIWLLCSLSPNNLGRYNRAPNKPVKCGGGKMSELLCNKCINVLHSVITLWLVMSCDWMHEHNCVYILCNTIPFTLPMYILYESLHSKSLVLPPPCLTDSRSPFDPFNELYGFLFDTTYNNKLSIYSWDINSSNYVAFGI